MKIQLLIAEQLTQVILTPETEHEKSVLGHIDKDRYEISIYKSEFESCRRGWIRQFNYPDHVEARDTIFVLTPIKEKERLRIVK